MTHRLSIRPFARHVQQQQILRHLQAPMDKAARNRNRKCFGEMRECLVNGLLDTVFGL
jgi:hypothetical protein